MSLTEKFDKLQRVLNEAIQSHGRLFVSRQEVGSNFDNLAKKFITKNLFSELKTSIKRIMDRVAAVDPFPGQIGTYDMQFGQAYKGVPVDEVFALFVLQKMDSPRPGNPTDIQDAFSDMMRNGDREGYRGSFDEVMNKLVDGSVYGPLYDFLDSKDLPRRIKSMLMGYTGGDEEAIRSIRIDANKVEKVLRDEIVDAFQGFFDYAFYSDMIQVVDP